MSLFSCINDVLIDDNNALNPDSQPTKQQYYFSVRIHSTDEDLYSTRAGGDIFDSEFTSSGVFNKGLEEEKAVGGNNYAIIFTQDENDTWNASGNLLGISQLRYDYNPDDAESKPEYTKYVSMWGMIDKTDDLVNNLQNAKILVILNATSSVVNELQEVKKYEDVYGITIEAASDDTSGSKFIYMNDGVKDYFTMSSSMIVKDGKVEPANLTEGDQLFYPSRDEALQKPLSLYVERLQSKYTLLFQQGGEKKWKYFDKDGTPPVPSNDGGEYKNVLAPDSAHLVYDSKNQEFTSSKIKYVASYTRHDSISHLINPTYVVSEVGWKVNITGWGVNGLEKKEYLFKHLNAETNYFDGWTNSSYLYRNFWAEDLTYSSTVFPHQYRKIKVPSNRKSYEMMKENNEASSLNYFSFSSLNQHKPHQYTPESTFDPSFLSGDNEIDPVKYQTYLDVSTHVIVTAQLLIEGLDYNTGTFQPTFDNGLIKNVQNKYYMNGIYWSEEAYKTYAAEYLGYRMLNKSIYSSEDGIFYVKNGNIYQVATADHFDFKDANVVGGDAKVYIYPKETVQLYTKSGNEYHTLDKEAFEGLVYDNEDLMADCFTNGMMYYPLATKHSTSSSSSDLNVGDYGTVRNHWYYFEITKVNSPGIAVRNKEQEIIPNTPPGNEGLGVNIRILNWHTIETSVDVSGQVRPGNGNHDPYPEEGNGSVEATAKWDEESVNSTFSN